MSKVISAHAVSVDGYITGRDPGAGRGLGDAPMLFDWYFDGFKLSEPSAQVFDALAARVGTMVAGRNTYEDSDHFGGGSPHPAARLVLLSRRRWSCSAVAARSSGHSPSTSASASSKPSRRPASPTSTTRRTLRRS